MCIRDRHIAEPLDLPAKHDHIHFRCLHHEGVEEDTEYQADCRTDQRENACFPVDIGGDLFVIEAQHLDGGDFLLPLGDVDVGQIIKHHKGQ